MHGIETGYKAFDARKRYLMCVIFLMAGLTPSHVFAQDISTASNALDRLNFGDTGSDAHSESKHAFVNLSQPTGTGALGLTYREIAPSTNSSDIGIDADNRVLTFTMGCSPTLQNYLTIQVWGSDTISNFIYLYTPAQGYVLGNYLGYNQPELDNQASTDPILAGRFVYETVPIPLSMTSGNSSVTLTLNAGQGIPGGAPAVELQSGMTSRPIYSAFTHTNPYLIVASTDPQGTAPSATAPKPATYNSAYFSSIITSLSNYVSAAASNQNYGSNWTAAVNAGTVPAQVVGSFELGLAPGDFSTAAEWLNQDATYASSGNGAPMQRLEMLSYAYVTPNFLTSFYQNSTTEQQIVAGLDSYSYMQPLNGCFGDMAAWDGLVTHSASFSSQGRQNAQCSPIEGQGDWALGAAIVEMQNDSSFLSALNQDINSTLEPGVLRYKAYQTMLTNLVTALINNHGHAPNQDLLQAKAYVYANLALRVLDKIYGTSLAQSNSTMYSDYLDEASGINPIVNIAANGYWVSHGGLGLEKNGSLNGSYDGGYGWLDTQYLVWLAKVLNDNGIETSSSHPVRTVALNAAHAFSKFLYPSLVASGSGYATTMRSEQFLTFRWEAGIGPVDTLPLYYAAVDFTDPYAIHGFYLEHANGITTPYSQGSSWSVTPNISQGGADDTADLYLHSYADYLTLCNNLNSNPTDPSGVTFLHEAASADGVWADPTGSTISIKHAGENIEMVLNWRPLMTYGQSIALSPSEPQDNVARIHDTTATMDRLATVDMPSSAATGASGNYTSGATDSLYIGRYGNYLVGLNWQTSAASMTLPPDMETSGGTATDLISGANYNLSTATTVSVPAGSAVALYQYLPTSTLSSTSVNFGSHAVYSQTTSIATLSNSGTGPLMIASMGVAGPQAGDYPYTTTCGSTLAANANCTIAINFTPAATGTRTATFSLVTSLSTNAQTIALIGTGTSGASLIPNGTYVLTSVHSGLALGDPGSSTVSGTDMEQLTVTSAANQQWTVNNLGNNVITLTNVVSADRLEVYKASKSAGGLVDQWPANSCTCQQWTVVSLGSGNFELTNVNSGLALDVVGGATTSGAGIDQQTYNSSSSQQWIFIPIRIPDGTYTVTNVNSGLALGDPGSSTTLGTDMEQLTVTGASDQKWTVANLGNDVITLTNGASSLVLEVYQTSKTPGALVDQWSSNGGPWQKWSVLSLANGSFQLANINSGMYLDVVGASTTNGAQINQWNYQTISAQQWTFTIVP